MRARRGIVLLVGLWASGCTASPPSATPVERAPAAVPPVVPPGGKVAKGTLARTHIYEVVSAQMAQFRGCYDRSLAKDRNAKGRITTRFVVGLDGAVLETRTRLEGNLAPETGDCVDAVFRSLQFKRPEGGPAIVTYPLILMPTVDAP